MESGKNKKDIEKYTNYLQKYLIDDRIDREFGESFMLEKNYGLLTTYYYYRHNDFPYKIKLHFANTTVGYLYVCISLLKIQKIRLTTIKDIKTVSFDFDDLNGIVEAFRSFKRIIELKEIFK